ncbi:MAG: squalene--hopene cyclase, partial [Kiritimatiellaceae bacterium]|nr:squalene--hopene cyclase [Kiritimatiellaceae bacterium]
VALKQAGRDDLAERGNLWLKSHRNVDGGWGDSPESPSNFTTTLLCRCVLNEETGTPQEVVHSILKHYGEDRTFSVPILTMCMLSGKLGEDWSVIPQLPFELAVLPHRFFQVIHLPVVSYALPALIAIGLVRHVHRPSRIAVYRDALVPRVLQILRFFQPESGGYLEAIPLTGFVAMSLTAAGYADHSVAQSCFDFLEKTVREDGSWPIDVNLSTWVTSLSVQALGDALTPEQQSAIRMHLLKTQWKEIHPFTNAEPGGWGWTCEQGGVPDADDTSAALLALRQLGCETAPAQKGVEWLLRLQNRDGGMPTFCTGWGRLPFDRSCPDLTAHAIRAWIAWRDRLDSGVRKQIDRSIARGVNYLATQQRADGSWIPLWFGNQNHPRHENPVYGTVRVLEALRELDRTEFPVADSMVQRGCGWLEQVDLDSLSVEELALLAGLTGRGVSQLLEKTAHGTRFFAKTIGLYFASLWYSERLYPCIFTTEALSRLVLDHSTGKAPQ